MRPLKPHAPYCIYRKQTKAGYFWYVRYWDETSRKYAHILSTGIPAKGRGGGRHNAEEAARDMLPGVFAMARSPGKSLLHYAAEFWTPDSPYVREHIQVKKNRFQPPMSGFIMKTCAAIWNRSPVSGV